MNGNPQQFVSDWNPFEDAPEELPTIRVEATEILTPEPTEKADAEQVQKRVDDTLAKIKSGEVNLATSYVKLGSLLVEVRAKKYWISLGYSSFGRYIDFVREKMDKSRAHLYQVISVVDKMLPSVTEAQLEKMGISKATELTRMVKEGRKPSADLIQKALDPRVKIPELRAEVFKAAHIKVDGEKGKYYEFGGCYLTKDERAEIERATELAKLVDPVIEQDSADHEQRREVMLRWAREFIGTYEPLLEEVA